MIVRLGIDIGATFVKYGVIDEEGHILFADRAPTRGSEGPKVTLDGIVGCASRMFEWCANAGHRPASVGIGSPGTIHPQTRRVQPPTPNLRTIIGVDIAGVVQSATGLPSVIDNDANCAAWAEHQFGAGRGIDNLVCLTVGSGIGSGFIIEGRIFSGSSGSGAELGHVSIDWQGPLCPCGNQGCLENYTSATALLARANMVAVKSTGELKRQRDQAGGSVSIAGLFAAAHAGDPVARGMLEEAATQFAIGILSAINLLDTEAIIIGGGVADADTQGIWLNSIRDNIHRHAFSDAGKSIPVGKAALGNDAGFIGAAALPIP
ncbi:MAG: ROK family protein [candidate division Zixibacteria bacterium]|nr:ROK family protein [candidate division Zixibacteria bacterium]